MSTGEAPAGVRISMLGGFAVTIGGTPVDGRWRLRKAKTLVKLLALAPGHRLHRDTVLGVLWPDADPAPATNNLHQAVHAARRALGASVVALRDDVLALSRDDVDIDVDGFERAAAAARASGDVEQLRAALDRWTGPLLPEDAYEPWCAERRVLLADTHAAVAAQLAVQLAASGEADAALALLDPLAAQRPLDEPVQRARMTTLAALGRRWDAIAVYEQLRELLERDYAAEPEVATKVFYRRLVAGSVAPAIAAPHNLHEPATSFVGRHREMAELMTAIDRTRLLTMTGPGGAGKSRLALELARRSVATNGYPDGVWLVELAGVHRDELVTSTTASALRLTLYGGRPSEVAVADQLAARTLLLVLDNCEHLLAASAALVTEVLARCPDVTVLTTSREPLGVDGEVVYRVPSLEQPAVPDGVPDVAALARLEAVQLFIERARQTAPHFRLDAENAAAVATVCHRLDGMPLALELAAARLAHLTVADLAAGLDSALTLLARRGGTRLDRQQTLAATLDWSHDLLATDERDVLRHLSIFAGGFELDAAAYVCDLDRPDAVAVISRLVDKSLVEADTSGRSARYRLLEVVRQYAAARLAAAPHEARARRRHLEWFARAAAEHDPDGGQAIVGEPAQWFDVELDNLRAALTTALAEEPAQALRIATSGWRFWVNSGLLLEGSSWLSSALDRCPDPTPLRARALAAMAVYLARQGKILPLPAVAAEIAALHDLEDDPVERAMGRHQQAVLAFMTGDFDAAAAVGEPPARDGRSRMLAASVQHLAGIVALNRADLARARALLTAAHDALAGVSADVPPYFITLSLGWFVDTRAEPPRSYGEETVLLGRRVGALQAAAHVAVTRALAERMSGDADAALPLIAEACSRFDALGDRYGKSYAAAQLGHTLRWAGDLVAADRALAEAEDLRRKLRNQRSLALAVSGRAVVAAAMGNVAVARTEGREALRMMERSDDVAGVALTSANLAAIEIGLGDPAAALRWAERAAQPADLPGGQRSYGWMMLLRAHLLAGLGRPAEADAVAALAHARFGAIGERAGLDAVQRACKAGLFSVAVDNGS